MSPSCFLKIRLMYLICDFHKYLDTNIIILSLDTNIILQIYTGKIDKLFVHRLKCNIEFVSLEICNSQIGGKKKYNSHATIMLIMLHHGRSSQQN